VSLCRLGTGQVPARGLTPDRHVEFWLIDHDEPAKHPHLDFVLTDVALSIAELRAEGSTVLVHCVAAEQRTPSAAVAYARWLGVPAEEAQAAISAALSSARARGRLWEHAARVAQAGAGAVGRPLPGD